MILGIHHVALHTPNFEKMLAFYRDIIGFEVVEETHSQWADSPMIDAIIGVEKSAARTVMLRAANIYMELFEYSSPPPRGGERLRPNDHGYTHICLDVDDIFAEHARLSANGMTFAATPLDAGTIKAVYGKDPDGNIVEIQQLSATHAAAFQRLGVLKETSAAA